MLAALIIAIILFGTAAITNRSSKKEYSVVYDLSEEINLEGALLKEYGVVNGKSLNDTFDDFLTKYSEYVSDPNIDLYFIYGNNENVFLMGKSHVGSVGIGNSKINLNEVSRTKINTERDSGEKVKINFGRGNNNFDREFKVDEGEYFYYVFTQETEEGEIHTVTS